MEWRIRTWKTMLRGLPLLPEASAGLLLSSSTRCTGSLPLATWMCQTFFHKKVKDENMSFQGS
jgi:hypothetical protein